MVNIEQSSLGSGGEKLDATGHELTETATGKFESGVDVPKEPESERKFYRPIKDMAERMLQEGYNFRLYDHDMTVAVEYPSGKVRHFMKFANFPVSDTDPSARRPIEEVIEKAIKEDTESEK